MVGGAIDQVGEGELDRQMIASRAGTSDGSIVLGIFVSWQRECTLPRLSLQRRGTTKTKGKGAGSLIRSRIRSGMTEGEMQIPRFARNDHFLEDGAIRTRVIRPSPVSGARKLEFCNALCESSFD